MAIQIDLTNSQYGVSFPEAYFRIVTATIGRQLSPLSPLSPQGPHIVMLGVAGYATAPQNDVLRDIDFRHYQCALAEIEACLGDTFLAKCYVWTMAQSDMQGSVAV